MHQFQLTPQALDLIALKDAPKYPEEVWKTFRKFITFEEFNGGSQWEGMKMGGWTANDVRVGSRENVQDRLQHPGIRHVSGEAEYVMHLIPTHLVPMIFRQPDNFPCPRSAYRASAYLASLWLPCGSLG